MEKIGQNPKIGQLRHPVAPQPYVVQKSWPGRGNSVALGLQRGVNSISLQCILLSVACSEWGACLTDFQFQILEANDMTPKVKIFENVFPDFAMGHRNTFCDQIWWKSAVAYFPKGCLVYHTKKLALRGTRFSPIFPKIGRSRPKLSKRCHPLACPRTPNLVRIGCVLPDLFWKDWFFGPKSHYNIGFQPTTTTR